MVELTGWLDAQAQDTAAAQAVWEVLQALRPVRSEQAQAALQAGAGLVAGGVGAQLAEQEGLLAAVVGHPRTAAGAPLDARALLELWPRHAGNLAAQVHGPFALAIIDRRNDSVYLAIDRVGAHSLSFAPFAGGIVFADRADVVAAHPAVGRSLDAQALFDYLYFYDVPAPRTIYQGVSKLLPGEYAWFRHGRVERGFYWQMNYRDAARDDFHAMAERFRALLRQCVGRALEPGVTAAFLSGGTDSSTVAGVMCELVGGPVRTYSIGFDAPGFDELEYARIAARHFGLDAREYYLKPEDILAAIPLIARWYDEPFANESAVPAYHCARMAAQDGYRVMLAGDGGDEIFGGNARYAKQKVFEAWQHLPAALRTGVIEPLARLPGLDRLPPLRKLQSYIRQANIPLPERMESYNFIYRQPLAEMFQADFLAAVDPSEPARLLGEVYHRAASASYVNRMMHLDLKFTLADNDLRKVGGMTAAAGIEVRYPLLDDAMVEFSAEVPPDWKVKGQYLRWFFKQALKGWLPQAIIDKRKHGFGLPFGLWAREHAGLRERVEDRLSDFGRRALLNPQYIDRLRRDHAEGHATYFGKMLWVIVTLEEWLAARGL
ncbi:MAG: asparagine synthase C-terminal domain-containing protein [Burkholderiales bacterium]|nr:asparagine synthase C-terminal domain-containing protein [Burkholderiales bacterium]